MSLGEVKGVCEDVYAYLQPDGSWYLNNTGFLVSGVGVISADAASTERRTRAYLDAIKTVTDKPVRTLVNTHHHGDHTHGNSLMSGATIIGHDLHRAYFELDGGERGGPLDLARALGEMVAYHGGRPLTCHA